MGEGGGRERGERGSWEQDKNSGRITNIEHVDNGIEVLWICGQFKKLPPVLVLWHVDLNGRFPCEHPGVGGEESPKLRLHTHFLRYTT